MNKQYDIVQKNKARRTFYIHYISTSLYKYKTKNPNSPRAKNPRVTDILFQKNKGKTDRDLEKVHVRGDGSRPRKNPRGSDPPRPRGSPGKRKTTWKTDDPADRTRETRTTRTRAHGSARLSRERVTRRQTSFIAWTFDRAIRPSALFNDARAVHPSRGIHSSASNPSV